MRVLVALSGGVDSAVCAARMVQAGYDVTGVYMQLEKDQVSAQRQQQANIQRGCGSPEDAKDAARVAEMLGMDFEIWDLSADFHQIVMNDFVSQYRQGLTPNPCVRCNQFVKFHELTSRAWDKGFDAVATGHYAKIVAGAAGNELHRAAARNKDQSYVLAVTGYETMQRVFFPLGDFASKPDVRAEAERRGLPVSAKPDSFDICFIPDGDTRGFLSRALGEQPGEVLDPEGKVVGEHRGFYNFTVGQRKGIGLPGPAKDGRPRYVLRTEPQANRVIVGPAELLSVRQISAGPVVWMTPEPFSEADDVLVQFRAHGQPVPARVRVVECAVGTGLSQVGATQTEPVPVFGGVPAAVSFAEAPVPSQVSSQAPAAGFSSEAGTVSSAEAGALASQPAFGTAPTTQLQVELKEPVRAVAAGQSLVVYREDRVLAQANITATAR